MSGFYTIDWQRLINMLLPVRLRKTVTKAWLQCLVQPVAELYALFTAYRQYNNYQLTHNSQVVYLTAALNDTFDPSLRRIYITDSNNADAVFVFLIPENAPLWLGRVSEIGTTYYTNPQYLFTGTEIAGSANSFVVHVPVGLVYDIDRMRALIDQYRLPSKNNYSIVSP